MMDLKNRRIKQMLKNFVMIFVPGLLIVAVLAGIFININIDNGKNIIKIRQLNNSEIVSFNVNSIFEDIKSDGNIILSSSEIKAYVANAAEVNNQNELKRIFSNMMTNKKIYDSIRFVGIDGYEKVRVNDADNGTTIAVTDSELEDKGNQTYFAEGMKLNPGEIYISPMDLSMTGDEIEMPIKPLMRLVLPVFNDQNERQGILVLNYLAKNMLDQIENYSKSNMDMKILLLNNEGYYLLSENSNKEFSFVYGDQQGGSFSQENPEIWQAILNNGSGYFDDGKDLYFYAPLYPLEGYRNLHWVLVGAAPLDVLGVFANEDNRMIVLIAALLVLVLAIISLVVSWLLLIRKEASSREKITDGIFKNSKEGIMIMDAEMRIVYINKAFSTITGYPEDEVMGQKPIDFKSSDKLREVYSNIWKTVNEEGNWQGEIVDVRKDGTTYPKYITISKIFDSKSDTLSNYLEVFEDLTNTRITEEAINKIKHYDEVTGLPTQALFELKTREFIKQYDNMAIIILQVTNFNALYDNLGKKSGTILINEASRRIQTFLRDEDLLGLLHKDQFIIARINSNDKLEMGHLMNKMMTYLKEPVVIENEKVYLNVSIGIAVFQEDSADLEKLIEYGNIAKNYALQTGDNTYVFYEKEIRVNYLNNLKLETELRSALEKNELSLAYQPQVQVETRAIIASEALLRWNNENLGPVSPGQFIPVAERTDLIIPIGNWVLEEAIKQNKKWYDITNKKIVVAVNLSPIQFKRSDLPQIIKELLEKYQMPAELLEIEITEGILVENMEGTSLQLEKIKALGVKVAIDDFGTGYSSLKYLQNFNFDKLKIDREFIKDYPQHDTGSIAKTILNLAAQMDINVIAEGVETQEQFLFLKENHCQQIQGYYFHKPLSAKDFEMLLTEKITDRVD
ncbi:EAL domain-containing protein [Acetobacterium malicum]|uniref:EAL domain-containing protein n=2 Tax=Acetobacterium malicum TaxID=52692 RepID=A0ABR6YYK0_9FIRM|nr:EAL domain-containing protein [Acetobacterium malicum]